MKRIKILLFVVTMFTLLNVANSQTTTVLFLGNSYTYYNGGLPEMFKQVATSMGATVEVASNAPGGYTFANHTTNTASLDLISSRDWNYVVLQEQSQLPSFPPSQVQTDVYPYAAILCDSIRANSSCTIPLFFMTWGRKNGDASNCAEYPPICTYLGMQWRLRESYVEMAEDNDAWVAPVGMAFKQVITTNPEIELYIADESHPSYCGTYLAACTFFSVIFNESPVGAYIPAEVTADQAAILQNAAWSVVIDSLDIWRIDTTTVQADFEPLYLTDKSVDAYFANYSVNADSCLWDFGDGTPTIMQYPVNGNIYDIMYHTYPEEAEYDICLIAYKGCSEAEICKSRDILSGCQDIDSQKFSIYPNPVACGKFDILNAPQLYFSIIDVSGKVVIESNINNRTIDVSGLKPGVYFLKCDSDCLKLIIN